MTDPLLSVDDLHVRFRTPDGLVHAVQGVTFDVRPGETLAVVGESGSGKSVTMLALMGLLPSASTEVAAAAARWNGDRVVDLADAAAVRAAHVCGREIGYVAQDPSTSLNPVTTVGSQIAETVQRHLGVSRRAARSRAVELLARVGLPDAAARANAYPHQLSGGMRQRVMIAIAISCSPKLLIADEPTTALDVTVQAQIIDLVRDLRDDMGLAVVWITHDLGVVADLADRVGVMYGGRLVELAAVHDLFEHPLHPYTQGLLAAVPRLGQRRDRLASIPGYPPELHEVLTSCAFAPRCPHAGEQCRTALPPLVHPRPEHAVACVLDVGTGAWR